jgi:hypothetical protein
VKEEWKNLELLWKAAKVDPTVQDEKNFLVEVH